VLPEIIKEKKTAGDFVFSIIIPSWNNLPYLKLCIESIRKNSSFKHQFIIHINEGKDGTLEWVKQQPDIDYTFSKENIGVCYALNIARSLLSAEYLLYINDDMYVCPQWDSFLLDEIKTIGHKLFFISATAIEPKAQSSCSIEKSYGTSIENFDEQKLLTEYASLPMKDWQGATWPPNVVHKDIWDLVGGYSTEFSPGMYSDPDFSMKLWQAGVRLFKGISKSRVYHFGSVSVKRVKKNKGYYTFISKWGITSSTLSKYFLRRGEIYDGPLKEPSFDYYLKLKNLFKRIDAACRKQSI
jgi:glycosyltransferase involved in cell wall biosynthesis